MKFKPGDETDRQHCVAMQHEFLRCHDAYVDFEILGRIEIGAGKQHDPWLAYRTYNAYSRFIHHLYEFLLGALARDKGDTEKMDWQYSDPRINANIQRIVNNKRQAIKNGTAPAWENSIDFYPEKVPKDFAKEFRQYRNKVSGHVTHERSGLSLTDFYDRNHKFLNLLYRDGYAWWGVQGNVFPNLEEITEFSILVKESANGCK